MGIHFIALCLDFLQCYVDVDHYQMCVHFTHMINVHFIWLPKSSINHLIYIKELCIYGWYVVYSLCQCILPIFFSIYLIYRTPSHISAQKHIIMYQIRNIHCAAVVISEVTGQGLRNEILKNRKRN